MTATKAKQPGRVVRTAKTQRVRSLDKEFADRDRQVSRGEYEMLGQITLLRTERGDIDFGKDGPFLGQLDCGKELVLMNEWQGFPALFSLLPERCPDCRASCVSCNGEGKRLCMGMNCGGYGKMVLGWDSCPADGCYKKTGEVKRDCAECGGIGRVVGQTAECPACKGTKLQQCPLCDGSGEMSTGRKDGAARDSADPFCATCRGTGRKLKREEQDWKEFELGDLEGYTSLGPIHAFLLKADVCRDAKKSLELGEVYADTDGNLAALLVKNPQQLGQAQYLLGGTLELRKL